MSASERSGWRDQALSERHRLWGPNLPAVDLDLVEYDRGIPYVLIEFKCKSSEPPNLEDPNLRALRELGDRAGLPVVLAFYDSAVWNFTCYPLNGLAEEWFSQGEQLTEVEFVGRLYQLRGRELPIDLECRLNDVLPQEARDAV